jgi:hypothetical protein
VVREDVSQADERTPSESVAFLTVQIVAAAMIAGTLIFACIAFVIGLGQQPGDPTVAYLAVGFSVIALIASFVASTIVTNQRLRILGKTGRELSVMELFAVFQTKVIVRSALLEGAAFFCCVAYLGSSLWWALATALVLIALMAVIFPTRGRFDDWAREQRELRSLDGSPDARGAM